MVNPLEDLENIGDTTNEDLKRRGFQERWLGRNPDSGEWFSGSKNPKTGRWAGGHSSSRNDW